MTAYTERSEQTVETHRRIHANAEETHVHILTCGERYIAVAVDVDPRDFTAVAAEPIAYAPTHDAAHEHAVAWMEQHPKGVAGDTTDDSGVLGKLVGALSKLDQSAKDSVTTTNEDSD